MLALKPWGSNPGGLTCDAILPALFLRVTKTSYDVTIMAVENRSLQDSFPLLMVLLVLILKEGKMIFILEHLFVGASVRLKSFPVVYH